MTQTAKPDPLRTILFIAIFALVAVPLMVPGLCTVIFMLISIGEAFGGAGFDPSFVLIWLGTMIPTVLGFLLARWLIRNWRGAPAGSGQDTEPPAAT